MAKHQPSNIKFKITMTVLRGSSYSEVAREFNLPASTVRGICKVTFHKCFMGYELDKLPKDKVNLDSYRQLLKNVQV